MEQLIKLIQDEIKWCEEHPNTSEEEQYEKGFISGLKQSLGFITQIKKLSE